MLVPRFWWRRDTEDALATWVERHPSEIVSLGRLHDEGAIEVFAGHGSPPGNARGTGNVPYVKVTDLKNWRINENPTNYVHHEIADKYRRRGPELQPGDLVSPARASSNIGQFSLVLPWQTQVILTREVLILRASANDMGLDPYLLLALLSLRVVQDQYATLALMQTNREHLGDHWREVLVPMPATREAREGMGAPLRDYFAAIIKARESYESIFADYDMEDFGTRP